jgi:HD-GYP domain-containing protein (c-di-GMP phosphodiesterase class II)
MADYGLIAIAVSSLQPMDAAMMDLYMQREGAEPQLYRGCNVPLEQRDLVNLKSRGITHLYIKTAQREAYQAYLRETVNEWLKDDSLSVELRVSRLNELFSESVTKSFKKDDPEEAIKVSREFGSLTSALLNDSKIVAEDMMQVLQHDYTTFTHSSNVSYYAVMLAKELGYNENDLSEIATGGLLHDVGKIEIDDRILTKPGKLDDLEFRQIRRHPTEGFKKLCKQPNVSYGQLMMTYQHHERLDGRGYPVGVVADQIHPWAKICAVVDVFEALTSNRPYRQPLSTETAFQIMTKDSGLAFDPEILKCWMQLTQTTANV